MKTLLTGLSKSKFNLKKKPLRCKGFFFVLYASLNIINYEKKLQVVCFDICIFNPKSLLRRISFLITLMRNACPLKADRSVFFPVFD